ncbi:MAG: hypothetical protein OEY93_06235 [Anaerolineae bacterium]|nr:hypothetical protein [Anaerolineae bacterium]
MYKTLVLYHGAFYGSMGKTFSENIFGRGEINPPLLVVFNKH